METTSTQSRGASITPLDQKSTPTVWCPGHWRACHWRPCHVPWRGRFWCWPVQAWLTQLVKTAEGIKQSASPGGPSRPGRKPPVPPKASITLSAKKKLRFTPQVSTEELAQELPFSGASAPKLWDTPTLAVKRKIRKKAAAVAKKKGKSLAKKALE